MKITDLLSALLVHAGLGGLLLFSLPKSSAPTLQRHYGVEVFTSSPTTSSPQKAHRSSRPAARADTINTTKTLGTVPPSPHAGVNESPAIGWAESKPTPPYPAIARQRKWEGTVILALQTNADGQVKDLRVIESSGYPILDNSALETVKNWRLAPELQVTLPIIFRIYSLN